MTIQVIDALKSLRRDPFFAVTIVLTLALATGATTAVFSVVNGVLLQPLTYPDSRQLVVVEEIVPELAQLYPSLPANPRHFELWRSRATSFESLAEFRTLPQTLIGAGEPAQLQVASSSGTLFDVLGSEATLGRPLRAYDEDTSREPVVVLTDHLWRQQFGADPQVLGHVAVLDGVPHTIVGVLGATFRFPAGEGLGPLSGAAAEPDAFVPLRIDPEEIPASGEHNFAVIGRLRRGVSPAQGLAELNVLQADIAATLTHSPGLRARVEPLMGAVVGRARRGLLVLLAAVGAVLLMACANLASLSLTRSLSRARDMAVRVALGASRGRLVSQAIVEQVLLACTGGALGLGVARVSLDALVRTAPIDLPRVAEVALDGRALLFAAIVSTGAGLLVSMLPAWRLAVRDVQPVLRAAGPATTSDRGGLRVRGALLAVQVALSVTLLVATVLLAISFVHVLRVDRGFVPDHVLAVDVTLPGVRYAAPQARVDAYGRILGAVSALPGVDAAAWTSNLPLTGESWVDAILPNGMNEVPRDIPVANYRFVSPDFFRALSVPLAGGRALVAGDLDAARATTAAVISRRTAERMWPGVDPIGRRFMRGNPQEKPFEVVGVCADGYPSRLEVPPPMMVYVPYTYRSRTRAALVVRTAGDPPSLAGAVRKAIWRTDPEIAVANARPMSEIVDGALGGRRYQATLFVLFGLAALFIATLGVYAVTAYGVSRRRREMNIRVALGADRARVIRLMVKEGFSPVAAGLTAGAGGALGLGSILSSLLFDVHAHDPLVLAIVVALVGGIGLLASLITIRQGLVLDPVAALRED